MFPAWLTDVAEQGCSLPRNFASVSGYMCCSYPASPEMCSMAVESVVRILLVAEVTHVPVLSPSKLTPKLVRDCANHSLALLHFAPLLLLLHLVVNLSRPATPSQLKAHLVFLQTHRLSVPVLPCFLLLFLHPLSLSFFCSFCLSSAQGSFDDSFSVAIEHRPTFIAAYQPTNPKDPRRLSAPLSVPASFYNLGGGLKKVVKNLLWALELQSSH